MADAKGSISDKLVDENIGKKHDSEKPRWDLLPMAEVEEIVKVLTFGAKKYSDNNWKKIDRAKERYTAAALRHIKAYTEGEKIDPESGLFHLGHAGCCLLFLEWFEKKDTP